MSPWLPISSVHSQEERDFVAGSVLISPSDFEEGAVSLALRVDGAVPLVYQLTPLETLKTGHITQVDPELSAYCHGLVPSVAVAVEVEWDFEAGTAANNSSIKAIGCLAFGRGGLRLVGANPKGTAPIYIDPTDWTQRSFEGGAGPSMVMPSWRLVANLGPNRRAVLFDASPDAV
jgi:hypothetical protein